MVRKSEASTFQLLGPRNWLRPLLPHVAPTGCAKTDGSYHCSFGPASPKPGFAFPTTLIVCCPPCCCSRLLVPPIVNGLPDSHEAIPLSCQPCTTLAAMEWPLRANGSSYTNPICRVWVRSKPASA